MRISGTGPSSVVLSQTKKFQKLKSYAPKVPKQAKAKRDGVINPKNSNLNQFGIERGIAHPPPHLQSRNPAIFIYFCMEILPN